MPNEDRNGDQMPENLWSDIPAPLECANRKVRPDLAIWHRLKTDLPKNAGAYVKTSLG
jgi:hypothetical protein